MASPARIVLIAFGTACLIAGSGVFYLDTVIHPMSYDSQSSAFVYQRAAFLFVFGGLYFGPILFVSGLFIYGLGYACVVGLRTLSNRI
jgi:hypothetical protein